MLKGPLHTAILMRTALAEYFPYMVQIPKRGFDLRTKREFEFSSSHEVVRWCIERFGSRAVSLVRDPEAAKGSLFPFVEYIETDAMWEYRLDRGYFKDADHAFEFKLRWA